MMRLARPIPGLLLALALSDAAAQQRYWHEGGERRPLRMEANLEADFSRAGTGRPEDVLGPPRPVTGPQIKETDAARSPVFRDARGGPLRALPGGVIVRLAPGLSDAERSARLARYGLQVLRSVEGRPDLVLVSSAAGLAALDLANQLHESGDFLSVAPNWWQARTLK